MQRDFNRAGEDAWIATLTYDFSKLGCNGLSGFVNYAEGYGAIDSNTGRPLPDHREFDITLDYHINEGFMRGFWLRLRAPILQTDGNRKTRNRVRAVVDYEIPIL